MSEDYYALYKGDILVTHGTLQEIHEKTGKPMSMLKWLTYPTAKKRFEERNSDNSQILIKVELEDA